MDIRNCPKCGAIFTFSGERLCDNCRKLIEEKLSDVKAYLEENPNAPMLQIAKDVGVSTKQLQRWIKEERLQVVNHEGTDFFCEKCGRKIDGGRFCKECKETLQKNFAGVYAPKQNVGENRPKDASARMRFVGRDKD